MKNKEQASQGITGSRGKKSMQFTKPTVEKLGEEFFLVAYDIFNLSAVPIRKFSMEEIEELPVIISWKGPRIRFETDPEKCFELLVEILADMNLMQDPNYRSFPLGESFHSKCFVFAKARLKLSQSNHEIYSHRILQNLHLHFSAKFADDLSGSVYKHIIAHRGTFHTQMSVSGSATGTGKSLMQTVMMYTFYGEIKPSTTSLTEASFYAKMEEGDIFGKLIILTDIATLGPS